MTSHQLEMVSMNEDHAWCLKYDGPDMMSLPTHGKHISLFDECKLSTSMLVITLASRSYALLQDILIFTRDIHRDSQFSIVDYIYDFIYFKFTRGGVLAVQPYLVPLHGRLPPHNSLSLPTWYRFTLSAALLHGL